MLGERRPGRHRWPPRSAPDVQRARPASRRAGRRASRGSGPSTRSRRCGGRRRRPRPRPRSAARPPAGGAERLGRARRGRPTTLGDRGVAARPSTPDQRRGPRRRGRPRPPRANRRRCRGRARPRRRVESDDGDGRPGCPGSARAPRRRGPAATSSPMRPRIALRVRPVRATSSERDDGPAAMQLPRRSRSGSPGGRSRCAGRARRGAMSTGLCSFRSNGCA